MLRFSSLGLHIFSTKTSFSIMPRLVFIYDNYQKTQYMLYRQGQTSAAGGASHFCYRRRKECVMTTYESIMVAILNLLIAVYNIDRE